MTGRKCDKTRQESSLPHTLLLAGCCVVLALSPDMFGIINILYLKANPSMDGKISLENMTSVYLGLDINNTGFITRDEYVLGWMGITQQSQEISDAYFDISDIDDNGRIDNYDIQEIFHRFDVDDSGYISDDEFVGHYTAIYVTVPFVVLFKRVQEREGVKGGINRTEFETLFQGLPGEVDGAMSRKFLHQAWVSEDFGTTMDADNAMTSLDTDRDDVISKEELGARFDLLATKGNGTVGHHEMTMIFVVAKKDKKDDDDN